MGSILEGKNLSRAASSTLQELVPILEGLMENVTETASPIVCPFAFTYLNSAYVINFQTSIGLFDRKLVEAPPPPPLPSNSIVDRPKVALLFRFFRDFRCCALLFMVILVIVKYKNR